MKKKKSKVKKKDWFTKAVKESQRMEKIENLRKLYSLFKEISFLMEEMSPGLKKRVR